jgi:hypothetical protein
MPPPHLLLASCLVVLACLVGSALASLPPSRCLDDIDKISSPDPSVARRDLQRRHLPEGVATTTLHVGDPTQIAVHVDCVGRGCLFQPAAEDGAASSSSSSASSSSSSSAAAGPLLRNSATPPTSTVLKREAIPSAIIAVSGSILLAMAVGGIAFAAAGRVEGGRHHLHH